MDLHGVNRWAHEGAPAAMAFVETPTQFYVARFLLGVSWRVGRVITAALRAAWCRPAGTAGP
jgi:hypothetical protein